MYFLKGLIIGLSVAAPVGPIGLLCIQRTLNKGKKSGFFSGLGAATADTVYGLIAAFGLTFISNFLISNQTFIRFIGGLFLIYLGIKTFLSTPANNAAKSNEGTGILDDYLSTLFLTITNPMTIMSFLAIFAGLGLGLGNTSSNLSALIMVIGVFSGSALWWFLLSNCINLFKNKIGTNALKYINIISGFIIISFGVIAIGKIFNLI
ncbi:lysine transporter LysE [Fervidicella metallireducens AeB]|uniref:Lysine transporter LysE n=1 Tax=Fervidicella metallireducens AeB TaxID=1403537 RepID=A0A017RSF0_9CLOT|nr:LysE family transporter [Fervidicella metallireducens]EYE87516.1 lysine transporter LysE [Fervidicella metallireducens AeB]